MKIHIRNIPTSSAVGPYKDIRIEHDRTVIDLGLFDFLECQELIAVLQAAIDELNG